MRTQGVGMDHFYQNGLVSRQIHPTGSGCNRWNRFRVFCFYCAKQ